MQVYYLQELHEFDVENEGDDADDAKESEIKWEIVGGLVNRFRVKIVCIYLQLGHQ